MYVVACRVLGRILPILKWDGTTWAAQVSGSIQYLRGVWGTDASNVWAVGDFGTILKWNRASSRNG